MNSEDNLERGKTLFESLIYTLNMTAMQQLAVADNPLHTRKNKDLVGANETYEVLVALKEKTNGNLSEEETRFLDRIINNVAKHLKEAIDINIETTEVKLEDKT